jgi:hypothetical protein
MKEIPLNIGSLAATSQMGWKVEHVPVAALAKQGNTAPISMQPTPFSFSAARVARSPDILPSVEPTDAISAPSPVPNSPGTVTLSGRWQYADRSNVARDIDQQLIEIRHGDGSALNPRVFCFTDLDGTFSCAFDHPGTTMRVWVRSWTNLNRPGGTDRLGVFSGIEVTGGCGSDSIDCSYPVQTAEITCADGATCDVGTWTVDAAITGEPGLGAHQMTQDLIRSWKKLFFDTKHGTGVTAGPARITYPADPLPTGRHTHAHVPLPDNGWISIEPPDQQSGDVVTHEYGHVVMANLWSGFTPNWPTMDCPSPHFIEAVSGPGCALSEGWANFWAWYSNEFYDGTNNPANYGPVWNFASGATRNLETRDNGTFQMGDQVEGNVAAALGDMLDTNNETPPGQIFADNLSDGIQHIWHTTSAQGENNFSQWWNTYWSTLGHDQCQALGILLLNTINYTNPCPDLVVQSITTIPASPIVGQVVNVTVTVRNQGAGPAGSFNVDWYANRATAPGPGLFGDFSCTFASLATGATATCTRTFVYNTAGTFNMWAQVDTEGFVSETNENNNVFGPQAIEIEALPTFTLTVAIAGSGSGTVISEPPGIDCPPDCQATYDLDTVVILTPTPGPRTVFTGWSGDPDCSDGVVTMNADKTCIASFELDPSRRGPQLIDLLGGNRAIIQ